MEHTKSSKPNLGKTIKGVGQFSFFLGIWKIIAALLLVSMLAEREEPLSLISQTYTDVSINICIGIILIIFGNRIKDSIDKNTKNYIWIIVILSGTLSLLNFAIGTGKLTLITLLFLYSIYATTQLKYIKLQDKKHQYKINGKKWILVIFAFILLIGLGVGLDINQYNYPANEEIGHFNEEENIAYNNFLESSEKYLIKDVGVISIPTNMEIQSGNWKKWNDEMETAFAEKFDYEISGNKVMFQQKGLNDLDPSSFNTYARISIETFIDNIGDYDKLATKLLVPQHELNELNELLKAQLEQSFINTELKLIKWYEVSIKTINGRSVLKTSYLRQLSDNPYVYVEIYQFQNNDRMHQLILSYREEDADIWKQSFDYTLKSFEITNVR